MGSAEVKLAADSGSSEYGRECAPFNMTDTQVKCFVVRAAYERVISLTALMNKTNTLAGCEIEPIRACQLDFEGILGEPSAF